jgi:tetratricopeptide (TPR) repeat protein
MDILQEYNDKLLNAEEKFLTDIFECHVQTLDVFTFAENNLIPELKAKSALLLSKIYTINNNFNEAQNYVHIAYDIFENLSDQQHLIDSTNWIGRIYEKKGSYNLAYKYYQENLIAAEKIGYKKGIAEAQVGSGVSLCQWGDYDQALEFHLAALKLLESEDSQLAKAYTLVQIGDVYQEINSLEKSLHFYTEALAIRTEINDRSGISAILYRIGSVNIELKQFDEAENFLVRARSIQEELGQTLTLSQTLTSLGRIYQSRDQFEEALQFYYESIVLNEVNADQFSRSNNYLNIANCFMNLSHMDAALSNAEKGLEIATQNKVLKMKAFAYYTLSEIYKTQKDFEKAYEFLIKNQEIKVELFESNKEKHISEMQVKFETEQKQSELEIYQLKNIELRKANDNLVKAQQELVEAERKNSVLAMAVTANHEINQPLMVIKGTSQLLRMTLNDDDLTEKQLKYFDKMELAIERVQDILQKLTDMQDFDYVSYSNKAQMFAVSKKK